MQRSEASRALPLKTPMAWALMAVSAVFVLIGILYRNFTIDDAFIFLVYARHLATTGQMAFNLGEPVNAISSPLWFCISFLGYKLSSPLGSLDMPVLVMRLASGVFTWTAACLFVVLAFRLLSSAALRALAIALFLSDAWLWRWAFSGMEAGLAMLLVTVSLFLYTSRNSLFRFWSALLLMSIGALTRPELAVLSLLVMADYLRNVGAGRDRVQIPTAIISVLAAAVPVVLWLTFAHKTMHSVIPQTAAVKSGIVGRGESLRYAAQVLFASQPVAITLCAMGCIMFAWTRIARRSIAAETEHEHWRLLLPFGLWVVALPAFYVFREYVPLARYLLMIMPCLVIVSVMSFEWMATHVAGVRRGIGALALGAGLAAWAVWGFVTVTRALPVSGGQMEKAYRVMGRWIREHTPQDARIAAGEIGTLGYYGDRYLIDCGGLVLPANQLPLWQRGPTTLLKAVKADYTLTPYDYRLAGVDYEPLLSWKVQGHRASMKRDWVNLVLYRSRWSQEGTR